MATAEEIIVKLIAQNDQLKAGMAEGAAVVKTSTDEMATSCQNAMNAFTQFDNIQKGSIKTAQDVATAQKAINAAQASGAFTAEELAAKQTLVDAAMLKIGPDTQAAAGALSMFTRNSRTMYSTSALITDAMTGQFSRMRREVAALGNETGLMAAAFRAAMGPIGAAAAVVGAIGFAAVEANAAFGRFEQAAMQTGDATGYSAGQLQVMAQDLGTATGKTFDASDAVRNLASTGRFAGDQMRQASEAAVNFAAMTGESVKEAADTITKLREDPLKAVVALNDQFHFLTLAEYEQMQQLAKEGDVTGAAMIAINALGAVSKQRTDEMAANANVVARAWGDVKNAFEQAAEVMGQRINVKLGGGDTAEKLAVAKQDLDELRKELGAGFGSAEGVNEATAKVVALTAELNKETAARQAVARAAAQQAQAVDNAAKKHGGGGSGIGALEQQFQQQEAAAHASYEQMKQDAADFWSAQASNAQNSTEVQAQAWQRYTEIRHQMDQQGLAADNEATRKQEENARHVEQVAKQTAEGRERAMAQASQEIQDEIKAEGRAFDKAAKDQEVAQRKLTNEIDLLNRQIERSYERTYRRIGMSVMQSLNGILFYHETMRQALADIGMQILQQYEMQIVKQIAAHIAGEQAKTATTIAGNTARVAADTAGQAESLAVQGASAIKWIMTEAAKAAAGAFNAMVSIPYIGPFVAVGASIAAFAAVAKLVGSVASAEGGWERVPADGMQTILHKDEMVLPKRIADPMRQMAKSGGNGGGGTINIHALDSRSFLSALKRNPRALQMALAHAGRNGW